MSAATSTPPARWSRNELLYAQRRGYVLETTTRGFKGKIIEVREHDIVLEMVLDAAAGAKARLYMRPEALAMPPPPWLWSGARVTTPYGWGVIRELRSTPDRIDYVVDLVDNLLTPPAAGATGTVPTRATGGRTATGIHVPNGCAVGFLAPDMVKHRSQRTVQEAVDDADALRNKANDMFRAKDYAAALAQYEQAVTILGGVTRGVRGDEALRKAYMDCMLKCMGNTAACYLRRAQPAFETVAQYATEALIIDPTDMCGHRRKNLWRRGEAFLGMGKLDEAIADLKASGLPEAGIVLKEAVERKSKQDARDKAMWAGAFAKSAQQKEAEKPAAAASTPDGKSAAAAGGKRVTFASPAGSATPAADAASPSAAAGSPPRALFAGATPHPAGKKSASRLSSGKSRDGDDDAAEAGASAAAAGGDSEGSSSGLTWGKVLGGVAVAAAVGLGAYFGYKHFAGSSSSRSIGGRSGGVRGAR